MALPPVLLLLIAYLLGSISGSLLLGKMRGVDIRTIGSGNAGGTNALRTQGAWFALGTVLVDVGKGLLAACVAWRYLPVGAQPGWLYGVLLAATAGHVWPLFHGFRGGKGAATLVGGLIVAWPLALLPLLAVWVFCLLLSGYVGLSTMLAGASLVAAALWMHPADVARLAFALLAALFLIYTHRGNIARLRAGTEPRAERARLLGRMLSRKST